MANEHTIRSGTPGGPTDFRLVYSEVAFDANGDAAVTAASLGLRVIKGFAAGAWSGTTNAVASVYSTDTFPITAGGLFGVTTINLEARESDAGTDADIASVSIPVLFWGIS